VSYCASEYGAKDNMIGRVFESEITRVSLVVEYFIGLYVAQSVSDPTVR
jgi:hypothetical protein